MTSKNSDLTTEAQQVFHVILANKMFIALVMLTAALVTLVGWFFVRDWNEVNFKIDALPVYVTEEYSELNRFAEAVSPSVTKLDRKHLLLYCRSGYGRRQWRV